MTGDIYVFFYSFGLGWLTSFEPRSLPLAAVGVARRACNASKRELLASASVPAEASVAKDHPNVHKKEKSKQSTVVKTNVDKNELAAADDFQRSSTDRNPKREARRIVATPDRVLMEQEDVVAARALFVLRPITCGWIPGRTVWARIWTCPCHNIVRRAAPFVGRVASHCWRTARRRKRNSSHTETNGNVSERQTKTDRRQ